MIQTSPKILKVSDWGVLEYGKALRMQEAIVGKRIAGEAPDHLVTVVHPPVVTLGRSGGLDDLRTSVQSIQEKGISLYHVDRGGMATFHGPGQLVAYPILRLDRKDLHLYVKTLIDAVTAVLRLFGLDPETKEEKPGVWVNSVKIASFGIAVRKWISYHGLALNVNTDPKWFEWIVPCGEPFERVTSMARELGHPLNLAEVRDVFIKTFCRLFSYTPEFQMNRNPVERPDWLIRPSPCVEAVDHMEEQLRQLRLATVCQRARCPNLGECFERGTATFMILGGKCTRRCGFCAVDKGIPEVIDPEEPERVAIAADRLNLKHVVVTSVTRDDLPDGGASQFSQTIKEIRKGTNAKRVEVLIPDFGGSLRALEKVCEARPDVLNHNLETVKRLYPKIRPGAQYRRSLGILEFASGKGLKVKSGIMLGLGETEEEVNETIMDLRRTGCAYLTIGQYLAPSGDHLPVERYLSPAEFSRWAETAKTIGFKGVAAAPLVRSSYRADEMVREA
ncbi:MAG: lipoyl synthase [Deltaproteobacteria bacterium]|nr:lipoyl synthase [Deltaproteobacteria bacterium]MBW2200090.1 lipoyl synthase [Deltaproteobacteria bacterium]MBW2539235.1 lipoyl synthase [Deltaproteobacteria bacterium]